jgi:hypothetical protein
MSERPSTMPHALFLVAAIVSLAGCNRAYIEPEELAARAIVSTCPPGLPAASPTVDPPLASLTVTLQIEPAVAAGTEATLRIDGETTRSGLAVDVSKATQLSVAKGVYTVRASLPGYTTVEGLARLTAGCNATMSLILKKPATR